MLALGKVLCPESQMCSSVQQRSCLLLPVRKRIDGHIMRTRRPHVKVRISRPFRAANMEARRHVLSLVKLCPLASQGRLDKATPPVCTTSTSQVPPCPLCPTSTPAYSPKGCKDHKDKRMGPRQIPKTHGPISSLASLLDPKQCKRGSPFVYLWISRRREDAVDAP